MVVSRPRARIVIKVIPSSIPGSPFSSRMIQARLTPISDARSDWVMWFAYLASRTIIPICRVVLILIAPPTLVEAGAGGGRRTHVAER